MKKLELDSAEINNVLRELVAVGFVDPAEMFDDRGALLPLKEMPEHVRRAIASIETEEIQRSGKLIGYRKRVKLWSKPAALSLLGQHIGLFSDEEDPGQFQITQENLEQTLDYSRLTKEEMAAVERLMKKATPDAPASRGVQR